MIPYVKNRRPITNKQRSLGVMLNVEAANKYANNMNSNETSEHLQDDSETSPTGDLKEPEPAKRVRVTTDPISQTEIDEVIKIYGRVIRNTLNTVKNMVKLGEKLYAIKARLPHGQWGRAFARAKFPFTIRTATRAMRTYHRFQADPALLDDPENFMAQIYGNETRHLTYKSDVEKPNRTYVRYENVLKYCYEDEGEDATQARRVRPVGMDPDEWTGLELVRNLGRTLDEYINQPIAETRKLVVLVDAHNTLCARLELQAKKLNLTLEQAIKGKRHASADAEEKARIIKEEIAQHHGEKSEWQGRKAK